MRNAIPLVLLFIRFCVKSQRTALIVVNNSNNGISSKYLLSVFIFHKSIIADLLRAR